MFSFAELLSKSDGLFLELALLNFGGKLELVVLLSKLLVLRSEALSVIIVLIFLLLAFLNKLLLHLGNLGVCFLSANDRLAAGALKTLKHGLVSLFVLFALLLLVLKLILNKLQFLIKNCSFLSPSLLGDLEGLLGLFEGCLQLSDFFLSDKLLRILQILKSGLILLVLLFDVFVLFLRLDLKLLCLSELLFGFSELIVVERLLGVHLEVKLRGLVLEFVYLLL